MFNYSGEIEEKIFEGSCCFTGYRPAKFPFSLEKGGGGLERLENALIDTVFSMYAENCTVFYTGMAMGFDILAAEAVLLLKESRDDVRLVCVVPFKGQGDGFPEPWQSRYADILSRADDVIVMSDRYYNGCYHKRNNFLVDNSDYVVTWFDGQPGGTAATIKYAQKKGRYIINLNGDYFIPAAKLNDFAYCG